MSIEEILERFDAVVESDEGWIARERRGVGRYNRGYTYQATFPPEVES